MTSTTVKSRLYAEERQLGEPKLAMFLQYATSVQLGYIPILHTVHVLIWEKLDSKPAHSAVSRHFPILLTMSRRRILSD